MAEASFGTEVTDQVRQSAGSPTNGSSFRPTHPEQDDDERLRGVVTLPRERAVLFTDEVELDTEKLPRWQPHISVDERRLCDDEHECHGSG
jgi:hypothetical protein